ASATCVSSTLATRRAACARERSAMVVFDIVHAYPKKGPGPFFMRLFDHPRHHVEVMLDCRGALLISSVHVGFGHYVLAQPQHHILRMRHRYDACGIDCAHLTDHVENPSELPLQIDRFGGGQFNPGKVGNVADVFEGKDHVEMAWCRRSNKAVRKQSSL